MSESDIPAEKSSWRSARDRTLSLFTDLGFSLHGNPLAISFRGCTRHERRQQMQFIPIRTARLAGALALVALLCLPGAAFAQNDHVSVQGHVTSMSAQGALYRVTLDNGAVYTVPRSMVVTRNIRV